MNIKIKRMSIRNFKGIKSLDLAFGNKITKISGQNASGKTTIADAFMWVLFNKDSSGAEKFMIRPVDANGNQIHNIEIDVTLVLLIDDKEHVLHKIQREKYVKKRGEAEAELKGSENVYSINEVPKKEGEFKEFVSQIIDEAKFRLLTDIMYFVGLDAKKRREMLISLCGDITDEDILNDDPVKWEAIKEDILDVGVEDAKARERKRLTLLKDRQKELPVRIDEISRSIRELPNRAELQAQADELESKLKEHRAEYKKLDESSSESQIQKRIFETETKLTEIRSAATGKLYEKRDAVNRILNDKRKAHTEKTDLVIMISAETKGIESSLTVLEQELATFADKYHEAHDRKFDENQTVCKMCGQTLPQEKIAEIKKSFEQRKKQDTDSALAKGREIKAKMKLKEELIKDKKAKEEEANKEANIILEEINKTKQLLDGIPTEPDLSGNQEVEMLEAELANLKENLANAKKDSKKLEEMASEGTFIESQLYDIKDQIANADATAKANEQIIARMTELENEQKQVGQAIALTEMRQILFEEYSRAKSEMLSKKVNQMFELARFELFEYQINGGIKEICEISYNGVKYPSLNSGHRIVAGLDIIRTFQKHFGVICPVWVDNAESINEYNLPEMPGQVVELIVTDDKELVVA